ncbi:MAG: ribonuclease domain-containing protein [Nocardioides sp.]|uniref:ribonuclease domain-containing protein n=1 Tax=Nocardioides sp. TaxID=35761 RepID=UPI0039E3C6E3
MSGRALRNVGGVVLIVLVGALWLWGQAGGDGAGTSGASARTSASPSPSADASGLPWVDLSDLPDEALDVLDDIDGGGPHPYPGKDGSVFGNFEGVLPKRSRGYYHEYTVDTPGATTRGARRIITGEGGELYWTADHYESFARIRR